MAPSPDAAALVDLGPGDRVFSKPELEARGRGPSLAGAAPLELTPRLDAALAQDGRGGRGPVTVNLTVHAGQGANRQEIDLAVARAIETLKDELGRDDW